MHLKLALHRPQSWEGWTRKGSWCDPEMLEFRETEAGAGASQVLLCALGLSPAPHPATGYSLVVAHAAVGSRGVSGVKHLPRVSVHPGWRQGHKGITGRWRFGGRQLWGISPWVSVLTLGPSAGQLETYPQALLRCNPR